MGRRFLLISATLVAMLSMGSAGRAQDPEPPPPPTETAPLPAAATPLPLPEELVSPTDPKKSSGADEPTTSAPKNRPANAPKAKKSLTQRVESTSADTGSMPPQRPAPRDDQVVQAQASAPPAGAAPSGEVRLPTSERVPLGKQSVAVTVDVSAPASMNLKKDATLKLFVRNTGISDAFNVRVDDELPEGLRYLSSIPEMTVTDGGQHLSLKIPTLPAGQDKVITIKVQPTKTGPFDHTATVHFETGCRSRTRVLEPKLKVEIIANPSVGKVLKGQQVEFSVSIQNTGDGIAKNVAIQAKFSRGLKHESGPRGDEQLLYELTLNELGPGATEKLDPLVADATEGGEQFCTVTARSPDVEHVPADAEITKKIEVVEPKLKLAIDGPDQRYTDTIADYKLTLENPGTAPARKVRLLATLPINGRLVKVPPDARFDKATSKLYWTIDQIDPGAKPFTFPFQVRMGGIGSYEVLADAVGEGALKQHERKTTDVIGMADVDLVVSETKRVVDVGGQTTFKISLRNYGTKDATRLLVTADLSANLECVKAGGQQHENKAFAKGNSVTFEEIEKLGPNKEIVLGIVVSVKGPEPKLATCHVSMTHEDLPDQSKLEDMASVKVTTARRGAVPVASGQ
jgi:uncharacterized repeat protein (TIGR01451 family)